MSETPELVKALTHRHDAAVCGILAANIATPTDRELLLRMQRSLLDLALHEDWTNGPPPPARSNALAVPHSSRWTAAASAGR